MPASVVLGTAAALMLGGCSAGGDEPRAARDTASAPTSSTTAPSSTAPPPPCTLEVGGTDVDLTEAQAVAMTGQAAAVQRTDRPVSAQVSTLARGLSSQRPTLPDRRRAARALLGLDGPALSCAFLRADLKDQRIGRDGLTPRAQRLRAAMNRAFGPLPMGGFAAGGVSTGHVDNSAHYEGRAIDVFLRPYTDRAQAHRGWTLAQWLVARSARSQLLSVIYRDHIWTVWASYAGWRDYEHPGGPTRNPVLRHLDHLHTAVLGGPYRRASRR